ncbi:MAG: type II secretion system protein GspG [Calditrichaeota bacterium]|nr:type II secretion system protein GspG [Calditrichota bacterium]
MLELQLVCVIIGVLAMMTIPRVMNLKDRARVAAAIADVQIFQKALSVYEIDYGQFPTATRNNTAFLISDLRDPNGYVYMAYPQGINFDRFRYHATGGGREYTIEVVATDQHQTNIEATMNGVRVVP